MRGRASTRAYVSWTRSSASSRDPHSAHAARYSRSRWSPSRAGSSGRSRGRSLATAGACGRAAGISDGLPLAHSNVVVEVEDVGRVVTTLDLSEAVVVPTVGRPDRILGLVVAEVVEPAGAAKVRA